MKRNTTRMTVVAILLVVALCATVTTAAAYTYDRNAAADYAYNNAYNDVPGSWRFEYEGGDCANFVSHSLEAGGWREIGGSYTSDDVWFYYYPYRYGYSHTWTLADKFYRFMSRTSRANPCSVVRYRHLLERGDVVQADWDRNGVWDHTMIVTGKNGNDPLMSYHSANRENRARNRSLQEIMDDNTGARFIAWSVHDNY